MWAPSGSVKPPNLLDIDLYAFNFSVWETFRSPEH